MLCSIPKRACIRVASPSPPRCSRFAGMAYLTTRHLTARLSTAAPIALSVQRRVCRSERTVSRQGHAHSVMPRSSQYCRRISRSSMHTRSAYTSCCGHYAQSLQSQRLA